MLFDPGADAADFPSDIGHDGDAALNDVRGHDAPGFGGEKVVASLLDGELRKPSDSVDPVFDQRQVFPFVSERLVSVPEKRRHPRRDPCRARRGVQNALDCGQRLFVARVQ